MYTKEETIIAVDIDDFKKYKEEMQGEYVDYVDALTICHSIILRLLS